MRELRIIDYLRAIGLTGEQIYGFWVYVATGHLIPDVTKKTLVERDV